MPKKDHVIKYELLVASLLVTRPSCTDYEYSDDFIKAKTMWQNTVVSIAKALASEENTKFNYKIFINSVVKDWPYNGTFYMDGVCDEESRLAWENLGLKKHVFKNPPVLHASWDGGNQ